MWLMNMFMNMIYEHFYKRVLNRHMFFQNTFKDLYEAK